MANCQVLCSASSPAVAVAQRHTIQARSVTAASRLQRAFTQRQLTSSVTPRAPRRQLQVSAKQGKTAEAAGPVTEATFKELVLDSPVPVLVDFWAPWCGPCRMIAPLIDEIAEEFGDKLRAVKLNTDESPQIATDYGIRSIPTVMVFKDGQKMDTVIGAVPKNTLVQTIEKYL